MNQFHQIKFQFMADILETLLKELSYATSPKNKKIRDQVQDLHDRSAQLIIDIENFIIENEKRDSERLGYERTIYLDKLKQKFGIERFAYSLTAMDEGLNSYQA